MNSLIFVDCEASGPCPGIGVLTEFGAVDFETYHKTGRWETFHGRIYNGRPTIENPALAQAEELVQHSDVIFAEFEQWLKSVVKKGRPILVSDNPAFDWQWINVGFWRTLGRNPFGHSARRISDFYAGLVGNFYKTQEWKRLRVTQHDHNPVHDAMGNVEAFARLLNGER
jgi:hypothetical protein